MPNHDQVLRGVLGAHARLIFVERDIKAPVQAISGSREDRSPQAPTPPCERFRTRRFKRTPLDYDASERGSATPIEQGALFRALPASQATCCSTMTLGRCRWRWLPRGH